MAGFWSLLMLFGWIVYPPSAFAEKSYIAGVQRVLSVVIPQPAQISTVFFGNTNDEFELIKILSTPGSDNGSKITIPAARFQGYSEYLYFQHLFIIDIRSGNSVEFPLIFKKRPELLFARWLIINTAKPFGLIDDIEIEKLFASTRITQQTELFYMTIPDSNGEGKLTLRMAYKMEKVSGNEMIYEDIGRFMDSSSPNFVDTRTHPVTSMRRKDMQRADFPIASILTRPDSINHYFDFVDVEVDTVGKSGHRLGVVVLQFFNATPQIIRSNSWGSFNASTGLWTGMYGDLTHGEAEFGGTPSFIRAERLKIVEYMSVSLESQTRIVFRAPKLSYTTNVYLLPFERSVWVAVLLIFIAMTLLLLTAVKGEWKFTSAGESVRRPRSIDIMFVIFSAVCNQGTSFNPKSVGGRIVLLCCLVLVVFLFISYCAFIVVLLQSSATNIQTTQDLLQSRMQIGGEDTPYNRYWLKKLSDPVEKAIYERRIVNKNGSLNLYPLVEGVKKIQERLFAFHMETPVGYRIVSQLFDESEKCDLREIEFANMKDPYATCRKNSPFREALRIGMLRVKEQGIQKRQWKEVYETKPKCINRSGFSALTLIDISPAILILCFGIGTSLIILLGEIICERYRKQKYGRED